MSTSTLSPPPAAAAAQPARPAVRIDISPAELEAIKFDVKKAVVHLYNHFPFWALLIERCTIVATLSVKTACVTPNGFILYNPLFFRRLTHPQRMFVLAHEVAHVAFKFFDRLQNRVLRVFNEAQDYVINFLLWKDFKENKKYGKDNFMPEGLLFSEHVGDLTSEEVYAMLMCLPPSPGGGGGDDGDEDNQDQQNGQQNGQQQGQGQNGQGQSGKGQGQSGSGGGAMGKKLRDANPKAWQDFQRQLGTQEGGAAKGLGIDVDVEPYGDGITSWEDVEKLLNDGDELMRAAGGKPPETYQEWDDVMSRAMTRAKMQGRMPAHLEKFITDFLKPKVHWTRPFQAALGAVCSREVRQDYTWMMANRRQDVYGDVIVPTIAGAKQKGIFAVDTSGSMYCTMQDPDPEACGKTYLEQGVAEVEAIRVQHEVKIYLMNCDADVHRGEWIEPWEPMPSVKGGGGTSFVPIFKHVEENDLDPDFVVVVSDGFGDHPREKPPYDVIWIMFSDAVPPYGEVIRVET